MLVPVPRQGNRPARQPQGDFRHERSRVFQALLLLRIPVGWGCSSGRVRECPLVGRPGVQGVHRKTEYRGDRAGHQGPSDPEGGEHDRECRGAPIGGFGSVPSLVALGFKAFTEKLNIAVIGLGTRGPQILRGVNTTENVVALCDVNSDKAAPAFQEYEKAKKYKDYRKMLETEGKNIDAVMIATPDQGHTPVALHCMQHGKHVYCEKPLTRTVWESRLLAEAAAKYKVATQMGNQGYSHEGTRTAAEILWSGDIGTVKEVDAWTGLIYGGDPALKEAPPEEKTPEALDWALWLNTAAMRPYNHLMVNQWRAFQDFGTGGSLGDWGVHILGPANLALQLAAPTSVEAVTVEGKNQWNWPAAAHIRYEFPARGNMPPVVINFYQNMRGEWKMPEGMAENEPLLPPSNNLAERGRPAPPDSFGGRGGAAGGRGGVAGGRAGMPGAPGGPGGA